MITDATRERFEVFWDLIRRRTSSGRWLILTHDNPDPDALASAAALSTLLRQVFKRRVTTAYGGIVGRAENRQMVKALGLRMSHVRHIKWSNYKHYALVDCQPGTGNNQFPDSLAADVVFDHHPPRTAPRAPRFADIREDYGASATILAEYLLYSGTEIGRRNATAMVYAIRSETQDFGREFTGADRAIYDTLHAQADLRALARIQSPPLPPSYFRTLHEAVENLETVSTLVITHLGEVRQPDIIPEVADLMLRLETKTWSLCTGLYDDRIYLSLRTTNARADAGRLMRRLLGRRGKGGGHGMTAGGWMSLEKVSNGDPRHHQRQLAIRLAKLLQKNPDKITPIDLTSPGEHRA